MLFSRRIIPWMFFCTCLLLMAACDPAFAPQNEDGDLDADLDLEESEQENSESELTESETEEETPPPNNLVFKKEDGSAGDIGRQGENIKNLGISFKNKDELTEELQPDEQAQIFYSMDFGDGVTVVFSRFNKDEFQFEDVNIIVNGNARTGERQVEISLQTKGKSVFIYGQFWVLPSLDASGPISH